MVRIAIPDGPFSTYWIAVEWTFGCVLSVAALKEDALGNRRKNDNRRNLALAAAALRARGNCVIYFGGALPALEGFGGQLWDAGGDSRPRGDYPRAGERLAARVECSARAGGRSRPDARSHGQPRSGGTDRPSANGGGASQR